MIWGNVYVTYPQSSTKFLLGYDDPYLGDSYLARVLCTEFNFRSHEVKRDV
jgi:hypothetical protein